MGGQNGTSNLLPQATPSAASALREPPQRGLWANVWWRLTRSREAVAGMVIIGLFLFVAVAADWIQPYSIKEIDLSNDGLPPAWVKRGPNGLAGSPAHLLGTDRDGRDLLSWAISGTRTSMLLGLVSAPIIALIGMLVGLLAGYAGGWLDNLLMRVTDVFYSFPALMVTILVVMILRDTPVGAWQNGLGMLFLAFLSVGWAGAARLVRGSVLSVKALEYIEAARCLGVPAPRLIFRHILPNCLGSLLVWVTLMVPQLILMEAVLGYLQIRISSAGYASAYLDTSWGGMIRDGRHSLLSQPWTIMIPAVCVGLISIAFTFLGDGLRDALDPENQRES